MNGEGKAVVVSKSLKMAGISGGEDFFQVGWWKEGLIIINKQNKTREDEKKRLKKKPCN